MHENIKLPDTIDKYIAKGINKGKRGKRDHSIKRATGVIICLILTVFIAGIRVSPVMAANVAKIPGLKYIVELVRFDKGLTAAIDNDYIQRINKSCEKQGIVFTVKDIIADNSGIIVFYSIENKGGYKWPHIREVKMLDSSGKDLKMSTSFGYAPSDDLKYEGKIDFHIVNDNQETVEIPDSVIFQTKIAVNNNVASEDNLPTKIENSANTVKEDIDTVLDEVWTVEFSIDKSKFSEIEKVYKIDQQFEVEGQKILFEDIKVYPTKSILTVSYDEANSKRIFRFEDLKLIDEKGQEWGRISSGMTGKLGEYSHTFNFQSNYFYKPKELYITGNSIRALDKNSCYFTVDIDNKSVTSPNNLVSFSSLLVLKDILKLDLELKKDFENIHHSYDISNEALDANGNKLAIISSGMGSTESESYINYEIRLKENYKGPITFKIHDYPTKIKGEFKVKIPLD